MFISGLNFDLDPFFYICRSQEQVEDDQLVLDLVYITERIICKYYTKTSRWALIMCLSIFRKCWQYSACHGYQEPINLYRR